MTRRDARSNRTPNGADRGLKGVGPEPAPRDDGGEQPQNGVEADVRVLATPDVKDDRAQHEQDQPRGRQRCEPGQDADQRWDDQRQARASAIPANSRRPVGISTMYVIPPCGLGEGRSNKKVWKTKKRPSNTCRTHTAMFIYYLPKGGTVRRQHC